MSSDGLPVGARVALDGLAEATDRKANFMGHLNRIYGTESVAPIGDLKGDYGFIVE